MPANRLVTSPAHLTRLPVVTCLLILAMLMLASVSLAAQTARPDSTFATVSGIVYDSLDGHPLAGALVQMVPRSSTGGLRSVRTDSSGGFRLTAVPPGEYLIGFWHGGFFGRFPPDRRATGRVPDRLLARHARFAGTRCAAASALH